jgi:acetate kinase
LAGLDAIVFSGCYAKTLAPVIHNIIKSISFLGITLKMLPWEKNINEISADDSKIKAYLNATSLPQVIFEETKKIL